MYDKLPEEIITAIEEMVVYNLMECADNFRAYRQKDDLHIQEYNQAYEYGCCGYADEDYVDTHGDTWTIGCNYGH